MKNKSLQQSFSDYIYECQYSKVLRPDTIKGYKDVVMCFLKMVPEANDLSRLTPETITKFFKHLHVRKRIVGKNTEKQGVKDSTIKTYGSKLNSFFEWLKDRGEIEENPITKIKLPQPHYDDHQALKKDEISKIMAAIIQNPKNNFLRKRDMLMVSILLYCGLRRGELAGLELRDIDMNKEVLTIRAETSKSRRMRQIPINPLLLMNLQDYLKERKERECKAGYLLIPDNRDSKFTLHGLKHWVNRLRNLSGIRFHLHQFRHTFACMLVKSGASSAIIQKLMGHTDLRMTERYLRSLGVEDFRKDINKLDLDNLL